MKSPEYLNEQAELADLLRVSIRLGEGAPAMADRILQSDWLKQHVRHVLATEPLPVAALFGLTDQEAAEIARRYTPTPSGSAAGVINLPGGDAA